MRLFGKKKDPAPAPATSAAAGGGPAKSKQDTRLALFNKYSEGSDRIGPSGVEKLCADLALPPEDIKVLIFAWTLRAQEQGYFSRDEWLTGLASLDASDPAGIVDRLCQLETSFAGQAGLRSNSFKDFYRYAFKFSRDPGQKSIDGATAGAMLSLVMSGRSPHASGFVQFLEAKKIRGMNEDQWMSFLAFCLEVLPDLSNFDVDGAWPSMLDEYYTYAINGGSGGASV